LSPIGTFQLVIRCCARFTPAGHKDYENAIANLTQFYQSKAVAFQGPSSYHNDIRWIGTEAGTSPDNTWSTSDDSQAYGGGSKDGTTWVPVGLSIRDSSINQIGVDVGIDPACLRHSIAAG